MIDLEKTLERLERTAIECALTVSHGNIAAAARALSINRQTLCKKIDRLGIDTDDFRDLVLDDRPIADDSIGTTVKPASSSAIRNLVLQHVLGALEANHWNRTHAAQELGISLRTIRNYIREAKALGIPTYRSTYDLRRKKFGKAK